MRYWLEVMVFVGFPWAVTVCWCIDNVRLVFRPTTPEAPDGE